MRRKLRFKENSMNLIRDYSRNSTHNKYTKETYSNKGEKMHFGNKPKSNRLKLKKRRGKIK
jgi:hypothetical protein